MCNETGYMGRFASFSTGFFLFFRGLQWEKVGNFFFSVFFFIFTTTHVTPRQTGGEGGGW